MALRGRGAAAEGRISPCLYGTRKKLRDCKRAEEERPESLARSRAVFPGGPHYCPPPERQVPGAAGGDELEPSVAAPGEESRSAADVSRDLQLVHGRV